MDVKSTRLARLRQIIKTRFGGNQGKLADFLGIKRQQMSRWLTDNNSARQGIAEESARQIEEKLGLTHGWLDGFGGGESVVVESEYLDAVKAFYEVYSTTSDGGREFLRNTIQIVSRSFAEQAAGESKRHA